MMANLPDCVLLEIFSSLPLADRTRARKVCKNWRRVADANCLWPGSVKLFREPRNDAEAIIRAAGRRLRAIVLKDRRDSDVLLRTIAANCPKLEKLRVDHGSTEFQEPTFPAVAKFCPRLWQLGIVGHWTLRSNLLQALATNFRNLTCVDLSKCTHVEMTPLVELVRNIRHLLLLDCSDVDIQDVVLLELARYHQGTLKALYFSGYFTRDPGLAALGTLTNLEGLAIQWPPIGHIAELRAAMLELNKLKFLGFFGLNNTQFLMDFLDEENYPDLRHLTLKWCDGLLNLTISRITRSLPKLKSLVLGSASDINDVHDDGVRMVTRNCHQLETFAVLASDYVTDSSIKELALAIPSLKHLYLRDLPAVTDECLTRIVHQRRDLRIYHEKWAREERRAFRNPVDDDEPGDMRDAFEAVVNRNPSLESLLASI